MTPLVFDDVLTNPTEYNLLSGLKIYEENNCDSLIAFGGGSPLDLAKCLGLLASHQGPIGRYAILNGGIEKISRPLPPLIAIPTTAGSGSEVGRAALLTLKTGKKMGFLSKELLPVAVIADPELTFNTPPLLSAGAGMDAIAHCVETFCSPRFNPVADAIALDGLVRGIQALREIMKDGNAVKARENMMLASIQGGLAFQKSLGAVHSLSHPLGALTEKKLHHGTLNAIFLPHVLRENQDACPEKFVTIAERLKLESKEKVPAFFHNFTAELGLPASLSELGLSKADLVPLAEQALNDHCTATNPKKLSEDDFKRLYLQAL